METRREMVIVIGNSKHSFSYVHLCNQTPNLYHTFISFDVITHPLESSYFSRYWVLLSGAGVRKRTYCTVVSIRKGGHPAVETLSKQILDRFKHNLNLLACQFMSRYPTHANMGGKKGHQTRMRMRPIMPGN